MLNTCRCDEARQRHVCSQSRRRRTCLRTHGVNSNNPAPYMQVQTWAEHLQADLDSSEAQGAAVRQERDALVGELNQACIPSACAAA